MNNEDREKIIKYLLNYKSLWLLLSSHLTLKEYGLKMLNIFTDIDDLIKRLKEENDKEL